jgi:parvulin-like peptidyl-prolyl isomerase
VEPGLNIKSALREPVLHFLLIGIAIFAAYGLVAPNSKEGARIVVTQGVVDALAREYQARWQRPPAEQELAGLVEAYIRDEIMYREGTALGLDRDDPVIKRRVRQKLDVIAEEQLAGDAPTDADLAAYLAQHADRFTRPGTVSFEQVYFPATATAAELEAARASAVRGADPARLGPASMLPPRVENVPLDLAARDFGLEFAAEIAKLPLNEWTGPVRSGFGQHLVRVTARTPAAVPPLAEVRPAVAREWENERRVASLSRSYGKLRSQYEVVIETKSVPPVAAR